MNSLGTFSVEHNNINWLNSVKEYLRDTIIIGEKIIEQNVSITTPLYHEFKYNINILGEMYLRLNIFQMEEEELKDLENQLQDIYYKIQDIYGISGEEKTGVQNQDNNHNAKVKTILEQEDYINLALNKENYLNISIQYKLLELIYIGKIDILGKEKLLSNHFEKYGISFEDFLKSKEERSGIQDYYKILSETIFSLRGEYNNIPTNSKVNLEKEDSKTFNLNEKKALSLINKFIEIGIRESKSKLPILDSLENLDEKYFRLFINGLLNSDSANILLIQYKVKKAEINNPYVDALSSFINFLFNTIAFLSKKELADKDKTKLFNSYNDLNLLFLNLKFSFNIKEFLVTKFPKNTDRILDIFILIEK